MNLNWTPSGRPTQHIQCFSLIYRYIHSAGLALWLRLQLWRKRMGQDPALWPCANPLCFYFSLIYVVSSILIRFSWFIKLDFPLQKPCWLCHSSPSALLLDLLLGTLATSPLRTSGEPVENSPCKTKCWSNSTGLAKSVERMTGTFEVWNLPQNVACPFLPPMLLDSLGYSSTLAFSRNTLFHPALSKLCMFQWAVISVF